MINIGIGVSWAKALYSVANNIIANFRARVLSYPNSIFEAGPCLDATLEELNAIGLLDNASLIVTPNAYNEGVLYDVIPNTPLGDMNVVRATTATRVNSSGLIEVVPRNLFTYSEDFANAAWTKANVTVSSNVINSPIGTLTADKLVENSANDIHYINGASITFTAGTYSVSIFAKASERNVLQIFLNGSANVDAYANFNLTTGVVSAFNAATATIQSFGDGWYRCILTTTVASSTVPSAYFCIQNSTTATRAASYLGNGTSGLFIWGAQLENFATATEYFPTTTRLNIPRIDYTNGSCPSLLVEPQRTNLFTYSEDFSNAVWSKTSVSITSNSTIAPDGNLTADTIASTSTSGDPQVIRNLAISTNTNYSYSFYVKKDNNESRFPEFLLRTESISYVEQYIQLNTKTGATAVRFATSGTSRKVESFGDYWRLTLTNASNSDTNIRVGIRPAATNVIGTYNPQIGSIIVWGAQLEVGSYPTSYIPTVASSVTRNADLISKTGIGSIFGSSYTIYGDFINQNINITRLLSFKIPSGGNYDNFITIYQNGTALTATGNNASSVEQFAITSGSFSLNQRLKFALRCQNNNVAFYINGNQIGVDTSCTIPAVTAIYVGNYVDVLGVSVINSSAVFNSALTDEQLTLLTGDTYNSYAEMANSLNYILE